MAFGEKKSFFGRLKEGLTRTRNNMVEKIEDVIFQRPEIDEEMMEELEETLILSDIGMETTGKIIERLRRDIKTEKLDTPDKVMEQIKKIIEDLITKESGCGLSSSVPLVILMIGVNGSGKTTSIAKIAHMLKEDGKKVMLAAADTFRAAAIEQLEIWETGWACPSSAIRRERIPRLSFSMPLRRHRPETRMC